MDYLLYTPQMVSTEHRVLSGILEETETNRRLGEEAVTQGAERGIDALLEHGNATGNRFHLDSVTAAAIGISEEVSIGELVTPPISYNGVNVILRGGLKKQFGSWIAGGVSVETVDPKAVEGAARTVVFSYAAGYENGVQGKSVLLSNGEVIRSPRDQMWARALITEISKQFPPKPVLVARRG